MSTAETATETKPQAEAVPELEGFRVYVGNLAYSTTEEELRALLAKAGGEILNVTLPTKFNRPGGYAFVGYKTEEDAKKAVGTLNESELGERKLQFELARSKEESAARRKEADEKRKAERAAKREAAAAAKPAAVEGEVQAQDGETAPKPKKKKPAKKREPRRRLPEEGEEAAPAEANGEASETAKPKKAAKERKPREARIDEPAAEGETGEKKPRERKPRQKKMELTGEVSKTTIFVANLPFSVDDEALAAVFTNLSIKIKSAHVVKGIRSGPGRRPFRASKGFGFVEVEDPAQQQEAVDKAEGTLIGDRKITAKIANEMKPIEVEAAVEAETGAA